MSLVKKFTILGEKITLTPLSLLVLGAVILRIPTLFEPYWYGDEAIYLILGEAVRQDATLYLDIFDHKPPLIYLLAAVAGSLFWFKFILLVWHGITIVLFWKLAQIIFENKEKPTLVASIIFVLLTTLPLLEGNLVNSEILMIGLTIGALLLLFQAKRLNTLRLVVAGIVFSLATLLKVPAVFDLGALVLFWLVTSSGLKDLFTRGKNLIFVGIGFATPIAASVVYYWWKGAFAQYINVVWSQNFTYIALWKQPALQVSSTSFVATLLEVGLPTRGLVLLATVFAFFIFRKKFAKNILFISLWFVFALFAALLSGRPYPHYLIQVIPAFALLVAAVNFGSRQQRFLPVPLLVLLATSLVFYKFHYYPTFPYYKNFLEFASGKKTKEAYFAHFDKKTPRTYEIAQILQERTTRGERVFIWGTAPEIYALSRRVPPGRYVTSFHIKDFGGEDETLLALEKTKPRYIIVLDEEKEDFPKFFSFLGKNYIYLETRHGAKVWKKVSPEVIKALNQI